MASDRIINRKITKHVLQISVITAIAAILVFPANSFVIGQSDAPPTITISTDFKFVWEATSPSGAVVTYSVTADDVEDGLLTPACKPPSDSIFPLGVTMVTCTATDSAGQTSSASFIISVVDTTPPKITAPPAVTVEGNIKDGANNVSLGTPTVTDIADPNPTVTTDAPAIFSFGTTIITWQARDASGNSATAIQEVTVIQPQSALPPAEKDSDKLLCEEGEGLVGNYMITGMNIYFINCDVRGNLRINNSNIFADDSNFRGNIVLTDTDVEIKGSEVWGNLKITESSVILTDNKIRGQVKVCNIDFIENSHNIFLGGIQTCSEGEEQEDDIVEEAKYTKIEGNSERRNKNNGNGEGNNEQVSGSNEKSNDKDDKKSGTYKDDDDDDKDKSNGNDETKSSGEETKDDSSSDSGSNSDSSGSGSSGDSSGGTNSGSGENSGSSSGSSGSSGSGGSGGSNQGSDSGANNGSDKGNSGDKDAVEKAEEKAKEEAEKAKKKAEEEAEKAKKKAEEEAEKAKEEAEKAKEKVKG